MCNMDATLDATLDAALETPLCEDTELRRRAFKATIIYGYMKFAMQAGISVAGIAFSAAMITTRGQEGVYLPLISGIIGFWLPSPAFPVSHTPSAPPRTRVPAIANAV